MIKAVARVLAAGAVMLAATTGAEATVAYNNAKASIEGSFAPSGFGSPFYASFSTSSSLDLSDVLLGLQGGSSTTAQLVVTLHADNGTFPGSQIATLGTALDSQIASNGIYDFHFATQALSGSPSGTRYWIEVADQSGTAAWNAVSNANSSSTTGEYFSRNGNLYSNNTYNLNFQMCVSSDVATCGVTNIAATFPTPEPASLALLGVAVVGLGLARSRARRV